MYFDFREMTFYFTYTHYFLKCLQGSTLNNKPKQELKNDVMLKVEKKLPQTSSAIERYNSIRARSLELCEPLALEDMVVQPASFVSPPKWHLAHTTWFFVNFLLHRFKVDFPWPDEYFPKLFNSYYKSQGEHHLQQNRGDLSRPTVQEIISFRQDTDNAVNEWLAKFNGDIPAEVQEILELGLQHEQQHQELLLMDIKYILWCNPSKPSYYQNEISFGEFSTVDDKPQDIMWAGHGGLKKFGVDDGPDNNFCFDNETPRHSAYLHPYEIAHRGVSNAEYADFIADGAYQNPALWLSEGWDFINQQKITAPLYWQKQDSSWQEYTLNGLNELVLNAPVAHISFHEAYAYARWAGKRLPSEFEWEHFATLAKTQNEANEAETFFLDDKMPYAPYPKPDNLYVNLNGGLWEWTSSPYSPYPGYDAARDAFGEYNGKFMINQMVLRGGCIATPRSHYRTSYRNFYQATQRWAFTGLRLAEDS
jgi:ergothioneine biosynthesis protein EgtB